MTDTDEEFGDDGLYSINVGVDHNGVEFQWLNEPLEQEEIAAGSIANPYHRKNGTGFPEGMERPHLLFSRSGRHVDFQSAGRGIWLVSDRAKGVLEQLDPAAFVFADTLAEEKPNRKGEVAPFARRYWLCDLIRFSDALDRNSPNLTRGLTGQWLYPEDDGLFSKELIGDAQIFRIATAAFIILCTRRFSDIVSGHKLSGFNTSLLGKMI